MEVVMNMMTMLKKGQEDELRDIRDDIREEEGRRGDVNDEIGIVGNKMEKWKIENEEEKEALNEEYVGSDNEYNDMKIDKDDFIGGEDDDPLNPVNLKGLLDNIKTAVETAGVAGVPTTHENYRNQAVVTEKKTFHFRYMQRCMLQEAMKAGLKRQNKLSIDSFPIEVCMTCVYVMHFMKNLEQAREASPVQSNLARDWILEAFGFDIVYS
ncbi:hypothetical protein M9H77_07406 [Catharanthus roseus]|uniref:Uncharacterized protein n=1 Tax=Catharanthus roseus TaxID=4058 RepID=A0ACC0BUW0_CATRO|nr:hypothetical protein M9H77_07406 [Catharanthus roseus]